jgi:hypothetical protein
MVDAHPIAHWYPTAAYLYVIWLDALALAWEYLRRNPDYRLDWLRYRRRPQAALRAAQRWGLHLLEDPALDAREAHPAWLPGHHAVLQLHPDADPPDDASPWTFWRIPGHKQLVYDGNRLNLIARSPGRCARFVLASGVKDGMPVICARRRGAAIGLDEPARDTALADVRQRPTSTALLELHTLQTLDAILAGATLREVAEGLYGTEAVLAGWNADGDLRARVRRLARRGQALMRGGYRRLAQLPPRGKGRSSVPAKRP